MLFLQQQKCCLLRIVAADDISENFLSYIVHHGDLNQSFQCLSVSVVVVVCDHLQSGDGIVMSLNNGIVIKNVKKHDK